MSTFLIADDSEAKTMMLETILKKNWDCDIVKAGSTEEAKQLIEDNEIDAAFIDYEIPTEQGPAVIEHLRVCNPDAYIAVVSSSNSDMYRSNSIEAGADDYVCSTLGEEEVTEKLTNLILEWKTKIG